MHRIPDDPLTVLAESAIAIRYSLQEYNLSKWGFVMVRCTYRSQEKWDKFVAIAQGHARDYFEKCGMQSVHDRIEWTIIEDAATLDGADIVQTSRRFKEWVERGPGRKEMVNTKFSPTWNYSPRYSMFLHVDEESLESVVDDAKARGVGGYSCKLVYGDVVLVDDNALLAAKDREVTGKEAELIWDELCDFRKRVKIDGLVDLYASLEVSLDSWYDLLMDGDVIL